MDALRSGRRLDLTLLFVISAVILLWNLGTGSLCSWDEGLYAEVSREILETGNWIDLHWGGRPWSDKPPLYMWMTALFYLAFGVSEFSVRLFSAVCGTGTVLAVYLIGRKLYTRTAALSASLALLTSWHFIWTAKMGMLDATLTFFVTLSIMFFVYGEDRGIWLFLCPLAFAGAFLTKGMGALVIPAVLGLYIICRGELRVFKRPPLLLGMFVSFVLVGWWHWLAFSHYGKDFVSDYFVKHLLVRTTTAVDGHTGDFLTYLGVIPNKGRPWAGIGLALLPYVLWKIVRRGEKEHLLPFIWAVTVLGLFSPVKTKLHWYIVPIYPALALVTGWFASRIFRKYTIVLMSVFAAASLLYLSVDKGIFDLDYSPRIKSIALEMREALPEGGKLYAWDIRDPGMQFYLGGVVENIYGEEAFRDAFEQKGTLIAVNNSALDAVKGKTVSTVLRDGDYTLLRVE